jgi:outer membrane protein OmpA-like peptidoglycan-associated protein
MKARPVPPEILTSRHAEAWPRRRTWLRGALSIMGIALLAACATPPPPPAPQREPLAVALRRVGFVPTPEGWEFSLSGKLLFSHDSAGLDGEYLTVAETIGRELAILGIRTVRVEGHTDNTGSDDYNLMLSRRRAEAVKRAMVAAGLHEASIEVHGLGRSVQLLPNRTPDERMQNRRVAVIVPAQ